MVKKIRLSQALGQASRNGQKPLPAAVRNFCFGCGKDNPHGLRLKFHYDEGNKLFRCNFRLARRFAGPPHHAHGGIIATVLDEAMSKHNRVRQVHAVTARMEVRYLRPVPLGKPLVAESREIRVRGREHRYAAEIRTADGAVLASGSGTFIAVDLERVFGKSGARPKAPRSQAGGKR